MARAVAPNGIVYGQIPADGSEQAKAEFDARMKNPAMKNAVLTSGRSTIRFRPAYTISI